METIALPELYNEWYKVWVKVPSYRFGQHFINTCISDEVHQEHLDRMQQIWNLTDPEIALGAVCSFINAMGWNMAKLEKHHDVFNSH